MNPTVNVLLATVTWRRPTCMQVLNSITNQTVKPDLIHLFLDGYGDAFAPPCVLPVREHRTTTRLGPGARYRILKDLSPETVVVVMDDDMSYPPQTIEKLVSVVKPGIAASVYGITMSGHNAFTPTTEALISGAGAKAMLVGDLEGLAAFVLDVRSKCGFDPLGDCGDDDGLIGAFLWKRGFKMLQAYVPDVLQLPGCQQNSQTEKRLMKKEHMWHQREEIAKLTGWPWPIKNQIRSR